MEKKDIFTFEDMANALSEVQDFYLERNRPMSLEWKLLRNSVSKNQTGWLFAYAYDAIRKHLFNESEVWTDIKYIHEWCVNTYSKVNENKIHEITIFGSSIEIPIKRLSEMDTKETSDYMKWMMDYFPLHGLYLKEPDRNWKDAGE